MYASAAQLRNAVAYRPALPQEAYLISSLHRFIGTIETRYLLRQSIAELSACRDLKQWHGKEGDAHS